MVSVEDKSFLLDLIARLLAQITLKFEDDGTIELARKELLKVNLKDLVRKTVEQAV